MIIKLLYSCIVTGIIAFIIGMLYTRFTEKRQDTLALNFVSGMLILWAVFQLISIPCIFLEISFTTFSRIYGGTVLVLCVLSLILNLKNIVLQIRENAKYLMKSPVIMVVAVVLLILQAYVYARYVHVDADDAFYVATAVTTEQTDSMYQFNPYTGDAYRSYPMRYVLSPFSVFIAFMGRIFDVHPTIMAHTILPVILTVLCFCVLYLLGDILFSGNRKKTAYFIILCQVLQFFSGFNVYQQGMFYLVRLWQGKAVLAAILIPFCFYMGKRLFRQENKKADWLLVASLMLSCCMVSSMGIMLGAICMGILAIVAAAYHKGIKPIVFTGLCCIPNMIYAVLYVLR